jgi:hypothetical protein
MMVVLLAPTMMEQGASISSKPSERFLLLDLCRVLQLNSTGILPKKLGF